MFEVTVCVDVFFGKKKFNTYQRTISMPFIPYPQTSLVLDGFHEIIKVETLRWCDTNETEKIAAFGKVTYNKYAIADAEFLQKMLRRSNWKKW
ncbi:MAG: hypothetical protein UX72_C0004G0010 [Parcubacteria group bacterium GW2011_GWA2_47_10]|nr:MAG: hypothetical protein UX72_C0004G0010 [Parcubacteria group bacterium GW2011_GWA2_47_10]